MDRPASEEEREQAYMDLLKRGKDEDNAVHILQAEIGKAMHDAMDYIDGHKIEGHIGCCVDVIGAIMLTFMEHQQGATLAAAQERENIARNN